MATMTQPVRAGAKPKTVEPGYDVVARGLHWLVFALLFVQFLIGWTMPEIHRGTPQQGLIDWHLSVGTALMFVVVLRLVWRFMRPTPPASTMKPWEIKLAKLTHAALYLLLLVIPVLGWAAAGYFGYSVHLFGLFTLPAIADNTMQWAHEAGDVHGTLTWVLLGVVGLHVLGALWHYFIRRDRVMQRMLTG